MLKLPPLSHFYIIIMELGFLETFYKNLFLFKFDKLPTELLNLKR